MYNRPITTKVRPCTCTPDCFYLPVWVATMCLLCVPALHERSEMQMIAYSLLLRLTCTTFARHTSGHTIDYRCNQGYVTRDARDHAAQSHDPRWCNQSSSAVCGPHWQPGTGQKTGATYHRQTPLTIQRKPSRTWQPFMIANCIKKTYSLVCVCGCACLSLFLVFRSFEDLFLYFRAYFWLVASKLVINVYESFTYAQWPLLTLPMVYAISRHQALSANMNDSTLLRRNSQSALTWMRDTTILEHCIKQMCQLYNWMSSQSSLLCCNCISRRRCTGLICTCLFQLQITVDEHTFQTHNNKVHCTRLACIHLFQLQVVVDEHSFQMHCAKIHFTCLQLLHRLPCNLHCTHLVCIGCKADIQHATAVLQNCW